MPQTEHGAERLPSSSVLRPCGAGAERSRFAGWFAANRKRSSRTTALSAVCDVDGNSTADAPLDLGAWLIEQGLAVAGPGAPFAYQMPERIAQINRRGVWGFSVPRSSADRRQPV